MLKAEEKSSEGATEMIEEFQKEYMRNGWELISLASRFITSIFIISAILFL